VREKGLSLIFLLSLFIIIPYVFEEEKVRVILEFYSDEALKEIKNLSSIKIIENLSLIKGAIIEIPKSQMNRLLQIKGIKGIYEDKYFQIYLQKSTELIGATNLWSKPFNLTGRGVKIAIIDTGIDYTHKDLGGKLGVKVIGGYDFTENDEDPRDIDGHGTMVAGIIAANGTLKGVAPGAYLLAYKVLSSKAPLRLSNIVRALERSVKDGANIINLSLGTFEDELLKKMINEVVKRGIMVVAAVGNSGPYPNTISEPAREAKVLGVGASCNLSPLCLSSSLKIYPEEFLESYPLNGSNVTEGELKGELVFVKYAREKDLQNVNLTGKIALAERGGDIGELVYFAEKELNVAKKGARALIIYNNMPGIFLGTLVGSGLPDWLRPPYYHPTLPVVSISREDGLKLVKRLENGEKVYVNLSVRIDPDKVAPFSSRGPSSFFTIKPNLVAPGSFINTTYINNSYYIISGTSFASPHVAGGLALIKEKYPYLSVEEMYDLISETSKPIKNPMGNIESIFSQGSGRLDLLNALTTPIFLSPSYLVLHLAKDQDLDVRDIKIHYLKNYDGKINFTLYFPYQDKVEIRVDKEEGEFKVFFKALNFTKGIYEGRLFFNLSNNSLTIPFVVFINSIGLNWIIKDNILEIYPKVEEFNQITATLYYPDGSKDIRKSDEKSVSFPLKGEGEYWIELEALIQGKREIGRAIVFVKEEKKMIEILTSSDNLLNGSSEEKSIFTLEANILFLLILSIVFLLTIIKVKRRKRKEDLPPYPNTLNY